jgi:hypothetical protein
MGGENDSAVGQDETAATATTTTTTTTRPDDVRPMIMMMTAK